MNYNLAGIRKKILIDRLDDEDFPTDVADGFINDAQKDIFSEYPLPFTEKIFTGNLPTNATMFTFPGDVSQLQSVNISTADGSIRAYDIKDHYVPFRRFNERWASPATEVAGRPYDWTLYAGKLITSRPTDLDYYMTIYYNRVPATLIADEDVPEVPEEFSEALELGAFYRIQMREGDSDEAMVTKAEYQRKLEQMAERYGFRIASGPIKMKNRQVGR